MIEKPEKTYSPNESWIRGIIPYYSIHNARTEKTLYVEVKRQGSLEGRTPSEEILIEVMVPINGRP